MDDLKPAPNSTDQLEKGSALAALGDWLEVCAAPELTFYTDELD